VLRTIICFAYICGYLLFHLPALRRGMKARAEGKEELAYAIAQKHAARWGARLLKLGGVEVTVEGRENIPAGRPCVFAANHRGYCDAPLMLTQLGQAHPMVSKIEVKELPLVNRWMELLLCVFVDRGNARQSLRSMAEATDLLKRGYSVVIFPEGTFYEGEEGGMAEFKGGTVRIAARAGAPVVPVAICGSRAIFIGEGRDIAVRPGRVFIRILPPLETAGLDRAALKERQEEMEETLRRGVRQLAEETAG